ncbi:hypothetical protein VTP01DRAFT_10358 [Rhizomucor pusillus]|uniref:uncharacterized protein n=1 Tax=Rhizomucor pusillus TaxID=4840 RepID=UPI0037426BBB
MGKFGFSLAVSIGALVGGAAGFYLLEDYKIKSKVGACKQNYVDYKSMLMERMPQEKRLALLLEKKRDFEQQRQEEQIL